MIHLDKLYWKPDWIEPAKDGWKPIIENLLEKNSWIMDGNYSGTMEMRMTACDTIIFLDLPRTLCVWRAFKRFALHKKGGRPDMAKGCDEKFDFEFYKWIWDYPARTKPRVEELLKRFENEKTIIRLESQTDIEDFFVNYPKTSMLECD